MNDVKYESEPQIWWQVTGVYYLPSYAHILSTYSRSLLLQLHLLLLLLLMLTPKSIPYKKDNSAGALLYSNKSIVLFVWCGLPAPSPLSSLQGRPWERSRCRRPCTPTSSSLTWHPFTALSQFLPLSLSTYLFLYFNSFSFSISVYYLFPYLY